MVRLQLDFPAQVRDIDAQVLAMPPAFVPCSTTTDLSRWKNPVAQPASRFGLCENRFVPPANHRVQKKTPHRARQPLGVACKSPRARCFPVRPAGFYSYFAQLRT